MWWGRWLVQCGGVGGRWDPQWSRIRRLPDTILFSSWEPAGMSIRSPWLAIMITVPCREGLGLVDIVSFNQSNTSV